VRSPPESSFAGRRNDIRPGAIEAKEAIIREAEGLIRYEKFQDGHSKAQRLQREFKEAGYAGGGSGSTTRYHLLTTRLGKEWMER
jgi:hypothetical protein